MDALVPDDLWAVIAPLLPPELEKPKGGRPRASDRAALAGVLLVLRTGMQWKHLPHAAVGCSGKTSWRRLAAWQAVGVWAALHRAMLERLHDAAALDWSRAALDSASIPEKKGGAATGPNPTERGKLGTKHHLVVDASGTPFGPAPIRSRGGGTSDLTSGSRYATWLGGVMRHRRLRSRKGACRQGVPK